MWREDADRTKGETRVTDSSIAPAEPRDVRAAPSHPDPYPYYARLVREQPLFRDEANGCWVVTSASAVLEVLTNNDCHTRPESGRVPTELRAGAMAELFGRLVRLRDDETHDAMKSAIVAALRRLDFARVSEAVRGRVAELDIELGPHLDEARVNRFMFQLPVQVIARLIGIPDARFNDVTTWLGDYGAATAAVVTGIPSPDAALIERGHRGARALLDLVRTLKNEPAAAGPLLSALVGEAKKAGCTDEDDVTANGVGLMIQGFASISSVIGLTLLALARRPDLRVHVEGDRTALRSLIQEVLRCDPCTNSTLRFMARDGVIAGQNMREGDVIIVMIAAANRDPALNSDPDRFDINRLNRQYLEFGAGAHACPADKLAPLIAEIAVDHLLKRGAPIERLEKSVSYAASAHVRTAFFKGH